LASALLVPKRAHAKTTNNRILFKNIAKTHNYFF
jgi:hypothetical protein